MIPLHRSLSAALEGYPGIAAAYLFGSRAHRESDVDVGVLLERATYASHAERFEARVQLRCADL